MSLLAGKSKKGTGQVMKRILWASHFNLRNHYLAGHAMFPYLNVCPVMLGLLNGVWVKHAFQTWHPCNDPTCLNISVYQWRIYINFLTLSVTPNLVFHTIAVTDIILVNIMPDLSIWRRNNSIATAASADNMFCLDVLKCTQTHIKLCHTNLNRLMHTKRKATPHCVDVSLTWQYKSGRSTSSH